LITIAPGFTVTVEPGAIVINGGGGGPSGGGASAASHTDLTEQALAQLFEKYALALGG
jgi:hypothetical protein